MDSLLRRLYRQRVKLLDTFDAIEDYIAALLEHPLLSISFIFGASILNGRSALTLSFDSQWSDNLLPATTNALSLSIEKDDNRAPAVSMKSSWRSVLSATRPSAHAASGSSGLTSLSAQDTPEKEQWPQCSHFKQQWHHPPSWQPRFEGAVARKTVKALMSQAQSLAAPLKLTKCFLVARTVAGTCPRGWHARQRLHVKLKPPRGVDRAAAHCRLHVTAASALQPSDQPSQASPTGTELPTEAQHTVHTYVCDIALRGVQ